MMQTAKRNYEKYGNPDGPGSMKIGIGLPRFLVEEDYQLLILSLFFLVLLFVVPVTFIVYYQRQQKFAANGVMIDTLQFLAHFVNEATRIKAAPEFFAASAESRELKTRSVSLYSCRSRYALF